MPIQPLSIKFTEFKPTVYTPTQYTTEAYDPNKLPQSLEKQYNWEKQGYQTTTAVTESLNKVRDLLNPAEYKWFEENYDTPINNRLQSVYDAGNFQSAERFAREEARKIFTDKELINKTKYNASREKELAKIDSRSDINDDVKRAAKLLNTYNYNGNVEYTPTFDPVSSMSMTQIAASVAGLVPEYSGSNANHSSNTVMLDKDGNVTSDIKSAINKIGTTGGGVGTTTHSKDPDRLRAMFYDIITTDSKINSALKQQYNVAKVLYDEANRILNDESLTEAEREKAKQDIEKYGMELTDKDGFIPSYDSWLKRKAVPMIESMAYKNVSTTDTTHSSYDDDLIELNKSKMEANALKNPDDDDATRGGIVEIGSRLFNAFTSLFDKNDNDASYDANLINKKQDGGI